jgi:hypothetical protein
VSSIVASEPAACRPILVDFVIAGRHFSWALLRHLPLSFLQTQQKSATHFHAENCEAAFAVDLGAEIATALG